MSKNIQDDVYIDKDRHLYFNRKTGEQLISWSKFSDYFFPKFDAKKIAPFCAGKGDYVGMTVEQVLEKWASHGGEFAGNGTDIHSAIEDFSETGKVKEEHKQYKALAKSIEAEYKEYKKIFNEQVLYTKHGIAGTTDKWFDISNHKDSVFDLEDYKNLKNGLDYIPKEKVRQKYCNYPIQHLLNCNFTKYNLQLSMYAFMGEELTGRRCRKLTIRPIPIENKLAHYPVVVPYLKTDIVNMITEYKRIKESGVSTEDSDESVDLMEETKIIGEASF
jgi:hypothetical protein